MSRFYQKAMVVFCFTASVELFAGTAAAEFLYGFSGLTADEYLINQDGWTFRAANPAVTGNVKVANDPTSDWEGNYVKATSGDSTYERKYDALRANQLSLQENVSFDWSVWLWSQGTTKTRQLVGLSDDGITASLNFYLWLYDGEIRWSATDSSGISVISDTVGVKLTKSLTASDANKIFEIGLEVTAKGNDMYSLLPYYRNVTDDGAKTYYGLGDDDNPATNDGYTAKIDDVSAYNSLYLRQGIMSGTLIGCDNFHITQVPEPSTLALLVGGLAGLLAYAWRKRK